MELCRTAALIVALLCCRLQKSSGELGLSGRQSTTILTWLLSFTKRINAINVFLMSLYIFIPINFFYLACNLTQQSDRWILYGNDVFVECAGIRSRKWWIVSDPCHLSEGRVLSGCSSSPYCQLSSETYLSMEACIVCCTDSAVTELSQDTVHACETIRGNGQWCHVVGGKIDVLYEMVITVPKYYNLLVILVGVRGGIVSVGNPILCFL